MDSKIPVPPADRPLKAYFLSDLHLGARYLKSEREAEMRIVRFLDSIKNDATHIYMLGDMLDYWFEYRYVVPRGYVRFFGKLAELADSGIKITWLIGNHDIWIFDYIPNELGIRVVDGPITETIGSHKFYLSHGDAEGKKSLAFRMMRSLFRNRFCQKLYSGIHPRWTIPFALGWSKNSRKAEKPYKTARQTQAAADSLLLFCRNYLLKNPGIDFFLFGHLHIIEEREIAANSRMIVVGEWISTFSYAVYCNGTLKIAKWDCR